MHNLYTNEKIFYYKDIIKNTEGIIKQIENSKPDWEFWSTKPSNDEPYKRSSYEFADYKPVNLEILNIVTNTCITHYEKENNIKLSSLTSMTANKYYPGKHMGEHSDSHGNLGSPSITIMINLNDNYSGGELVFKGQNLTLKPESGSILIYPSVEPYYHSPELITKGSKICCTIFGYAYETY